LIDFQGGQHVWILIIVVVAVVGGLISAIIVPPIILGSYNFWVGELQKVLGIRQKEEPTSEDTEALKRWQKTKKENEK
jgi:hypothetical protein